MPELKKQTSTKKTTRKPRKKTEKSSNKTQTLSESVANKKPIGRPKKITPDVLRKLEMYFSLGFSDKKACFYAEIGESTLYDYIEKNPEFSDKKAMLKESITDQAKINIARAIKTGGGTHDSWKWLEKKLPTEFGNKVGVEHSGNIGNYIFKTNLEDDEKQEN